MDQDAKPTAKLTPAPPARDHTRVQIYKLYGYGNVWMMPDPLFCETIAAQEKLHNWHVTAHKHVDLFQILYLASGRVEASLDTITHTVLPQHMILVPQMVVHEFVFQPASRGYILTLTNALLYALCTRFSLGIGALTAAAILPLGTDPEGSFISDTFRQLDYEYRNVNTLQRGPLLEALLAPILVWLHRHHRPVDTRHPDAAQGAEHLLAFAELLERHFRVQHQVAWYARKVGVTPAHLNRIAQSLTEKTALQLIHERLLLEARRELTYTARTIATIADSLGFVDPGYFTRFFKRLTGLAPKDFRNQSGTDR